MQINEGTLLTSVKLTIFILDDNNRVKLQLSGGDPLSTYINASYIKVLLYKYKYSFILLEHNIIDTKCLQHTC